MFSEHDELFRKGVEEFNARRFFEAHETWEALWRESSGTQKLFYQGLIQAAAGLYHLSCDNYGGACSQLGKSLNKLGQFLPVYHGIHTQDLVERVRVCLQDADLLRNGVAVEPRSGIVPIIELHQ
jgi:hypothetical protein